MTIWKRLRIGLRRLFCRHEYQETDWYRAEKDGIRFSVRMCRCPKCGKMTESEEPHDLPAR